MAISENHKIFVPSDYFFWFLTGSVIGFAALSFLRLSFWQILFFWLLVLFCFFGCLTLK